MAWRNLKDPMIKEYILSALTLSPVGLILGGLMGPSLPEGHMDVDVSLGQSDVENDEECEPELEHEIIVIVTEDEVFSFDCAVDDCVFVSVP